MPVKQKNTMADHMNKIFVRLDFNLAFSVRLRYSD